MTTSRKQAIRAHYDRLAPRRDAWMRRNRYFHAEDERTMRFLVPEGLKVLDLGCGTGHLLAALKPARGVGIDISARMVEEARRNYPADARSELEFRVGDVEDPAVLRAIEGPFDVIMLSDTVGSLEDVESTLDALQGLCGRETRIIITYYSWLWSPILDLAETLGLKMKQVPQNRLGPEDIAGMLRLADYDVIKRDWRLLLPMRALGLGYLLNHTLATLPLIRRFCVRHYLVARSQLRAGLGNPSVSVVIPCRNEEGHIRDALARLPAFGSHTEIIFVEGHSSDDTLGEIERTIADNPGRDIKFTVQDGKGKGDAVRKGFDMATGDVLMILDADLTVAPEALPRFYQAIASGKGEFINGTRLVYPMEQGAMRVLNLIGNRVFSGLFSWLLNQRFTDTLCGTKVLSRAHYRSIAANRAYFGDFDPFGDFDLLFGASKLNLKIVELPVRYAERAYGTTNISRFRHGLLLLCMVVFAFRKLKAF